MFLIQRKPWNYGNSMQGREYLKDAQSFEELTEEVVAAVCAAQTPDICFTIDPDGGIYRNEGLLKSLKCTRPSWRIVLPKKLLDKFFNGVMGIRRQYYLDPYIGLQQNHSLLAQLVDPLIRFAKAIDHDVTEAFLSMSLHGRSAKVWIAEKDLDGNKVVDAGDLSLDEGSIQNDWLDVARAVKGGEYNHDFDRYCAALTGIRAPIPDQLEVKGAWLTDADTREYVTADKLDRHCQLFMFGFT